MSRKTIYYEAQIPSPDTDFIESNTEIPSTVQFTITDGTVKKAVGSSFFLGTGVIGDRAVPTLGVGRVLSGINWVY